ncbi:Stomatin-like protein 2, mitochondrial [Mycoemilia scoparia]|uniref:Stomatin-like protein 2, mitochondrial n=1 Tax=Mycoemilia scoparia TaxID=417184 RepID=A0A9W8A3F3_9FUNG|nr:Stomatin-like protein 2, mitochondrial [Mycoemilia scoparia]
MHLNTRPLTSFLRNQVMRSSLCTVTPISRVNLVAISRNSRSYNQRRMLSDDSDRKGARSDEQEFLKLMRMANQSSVRKKPPINTIFKFVPQQEAWIVERMGRFSRILEPGLAILVPILDSIKYVQSLKEVAVEIPTQSAITHDNVTLELDGVLYYKVVDPYKASYGVADAEFSITQLAQTTMRAEIGQMTLDTTLAERNTLNHNIVHAINTASESWGIRCLRYEIRDIHPPKKVVEAMHSQVSAERSKRAQILESEGTRQAAINVAEGQKQAQILASEADKMQQINRALGEAEAIKRTAEAEAEAITKVAKAITENPGGKDAVSLHVAEQYVNAFSKLAKEGNSVIIPSSTNDISSMVTQAMSIYGTINSSQKARDYLNSKNNALSASNNGNNNANN